MVTVRHALQLQTPQAKAARTTALSRINDFDLNFLIFVEFVNTVKQYIEVCHAGHVGQYATFGVFGYSALMDADAFAVGNIANERQVLFELGRPGTFKRVSAGRDEEVRIFEGSAGGRFILERDRHDARHCLARRAISL